MSGVKAALKSAKAALDKNDFPEAEKRAKVVIDEDASNYFGLVFLARALEKQEKLDEAANSYQTATKAKENDELAWKGLCGVYEVQKEVAKHFQAATRLAEIYQGHQDLEKCQTTVDNLVSFAKEHGSRSQYKDALRMYLPSSPFGEFLQGRIWQPSFTFKRLAEITEFDEKERINREVGQRRTRLGAKLTQVQLDVKREVFRDSELEDLYQQVVEWTQDDDERRIYEEKLLQHAYGHMIVLLSDDKILKRRQVQDLAHGMVIIKHPFKLAWDIELEWHDVEDVASLDRNVLLEYVQFFQEDGLAKIIQAHLGQKLVFAGSAANADCGSNGEFEDLNTDETLQLLDDGGSKAQESAFAHRLIANFYLSSQEYEDCVGVCRHAQKLLRTESDKCGLSFENSFDAIAACLGTSLVYYQAPKNHPEAKSIFNNLLKRKPNSTSALLGIGLIHEEQEDFDKASNFLERALTRDPSNLRVAAEGAWCNAMNGKLEAGCNALLDCLKELDADKHSPRDLRAQISHRVGRCLWDLHPDKSSRKDRQGPYSYFIAAIRANPSYAPAYTSLGLYYAEYARDKKRARQCFQKALELSAAEIIAAEELARAFARDGEWDFVEAVAQRVIDSGAVKPQPGSKRKAVSWPFVALGIVQMGRQDFPGAVQSYQSALRTKSEDYHSWVGLGESYLSSGRYNAASKTLDHARSMPSSKGHAADTWFADYMYSNVKRELGEYEESIAGYRQILQARPEDFGVTIALLQSLVEHSTDAVVKGFFQDAAKSAREALILASRSIRLCGQAVNFWKAVGDACMLFADVPALIQEVPLQEISRLLEESTASQNQHWQELVNLDGVDFSNISIATTTDSEADEILLTLARFALGAQKSAVVAATHDVHARAVSWYNLGWTEYHVSLLHNDVKPESSLSKDFSECATAAVKCFKRAIELEAGNADFWNALGVVTTTLNPKISQHSFVRSLHLNERSPRTWTNLGTLYLTLEDHELAHEAFSRAQSTDPDYVDAWVGEGLVALELGDQNEARSHFEHAFEIADSSHVAAKKHHLFASFDSSLQNAASRSLGTLIGPMFASQQLQSQVASVLPIRHVLALLLEQAGDYGAAIYHLSALSDQIEAEYESTESSASLGQFVRIKADLARAQLQARDYEDAKENATTAADLSDESDEESLSKEIRSRVRLSVHLTLGLANYYLDALDNSISNFRSALEESNNDPAVVCLLAQVLWAKGGSEEKRVAKQQLFNVMETHPGHVDATTILGALAAIDGDSETHEAVMSDLASLRTRSDLSDVQKGKIDDLHILSAHLQGSEAEATQEIQRVLMIDPSEALGWSHLSDLTGDISARTMKLRTAVAGSKAENVAEALADVGMVPEAQRGIMLCPWVTDGWEVLQTAVATES
ncbi:MAG: hypothetical protein Q9159_007245 [Coniocarpon cinnabarinum]